MNDRPHLDAIRARLHEILPELIAAVSAALEAFLDSWGYTGRRDHDAAEQLSEGA